nr:Chain C, M1-F5L, GILGLVFTL [synthetic construct]5HHM_H Chain H, M1-F5L, GILGLVFTL [synthetic construct]5HHN_C Chain C, M1-F5L, GILGLVFTL [synthetic construct]
GILGLVFTL